MPLENIKDLFSHARSAVTRSWIEMNFRTSGSYWDGKEYYTLSPFRADKTVGSFSISDTGWYSDFADPHTAGDVFQLLEKTVGGTAIEHAKAILGGHDFTLKSAETPAAIPMEHWKPLPALPPPTRADLVTRYTDPDTGDQVFCVTRFDASTGKIIRPWWYNGTEYKTGVPPGYEIRPLLPFKYDDGIVLMVEGEKCQAAAQKVFDAAGLHVSVSTWHGGAGATKKIDTRPLRGRVIVFWPDNDEVGREVMATLNAKALIQGCKTRVMQTGSQAKGWDVADAIAEGYDITEIVRKAEAAAEYIKEETQDSVMETLECEPQSVEDQRFMLTDLGNAERFVAMYGNQVRYNYDKMCWMVCRNFVWKGDDPSAVTPMLKRVLTAVNQDDEKFGFKCESAKSISAMLSLASREPGVPVREALFDADQYLFNCKNALLDVKTGSPVAGCPEMLISKIANVEYDRSAECPRFMKFLKEITLERPAIITFLQRWFGASLSGDTSMQSFAIFYGHGANGKSTLTELLAKIMGDYAKNAPPDTFTVKNSGSGIPNDVAALRGARMVMATETEANARLAESKIKSLTGGDLVSARFMRGEFFSFTPSWKIIISTNHKPRISGADHGIWRRIILVPFDFVATTETMDPRLSEKLWEERSGILNWMLTGAAEYFKNGAGRAGLAVPEIMLEETTEYRTEEDIIGRFLTEECYSKDEIIKLGRPARVAVKELQSGFRRWCEDNNELFAAKMSSVAFGKAMRDRGIESCRLADGSRGYMNVSLREISKGDTNGYRQPE